MKRILFAILFWPIFAHAQFSSECFRTYQDGETLRTEINQTFTCDTIISIRDIKAGIYSFSISGQLMFENDDDCYIRILLKDKYDYEYLVYENYPLLAGCSNMSFQDVALETMYMDQIDPIAIRMEIRKASFTLSNYCYTYNSFLRNKVDPNFQKKQCQQIISVLNNNLITRNATWRAGYTSVSDLTYEEKKNIFGGKVPMLYGLEHYVGGIFVEPTNKGNHIKKANSVGNTFVDQWDWRNRHGKNWMSPVKYHLNCGACWAFASVSTVEAYANIYYNRIINFDLSEEEIISCIRPNGCTGGTEDEALSYIKDNGIVNENCFSYIDYATNCSEKCDFPDEQLFIEDYDSIPYCYGEDSVKKHLFKCPLAIAVAAWTHSMVLVGYHVIHAGDKIYTGNTPGFDYIIIDSVLHDDLIGKTAWIMKNSWQLWGEDGYISVLVDMDTTKVWRVRAPTGSISSTSYSDSDIVCSDADGDGLYFWGLGPKPAHCPSWAPDTPDGDDSDINYGSLDNYGNLEALPAGITIDTSVVYTTNTTTSYRFGIVNGGILTISGTTTLTGDAKIRVCEGGVLVVDGGILQNADIDMVPGSQLIVRNNGKVNMATGKQFEAPKGAVVIVESGEIN